MALLDDGRFPPPLAPFADAIREAELAGDRTGRFKRMFELGAALARYGAAVGLALLAERLAGAPLPAGLAGELRKATRLSDGAWFALARGIGVALKDRAGPAPLLAFAGSHQASKLVSARNDFAHAGKTGEDAPGLLAALLEAAAPLVLAPLTEGPAGYLVDTGQGRIALDPWLPWLDGEHAMIDAPHRAGDPWRAWLVRTGEHRASGPLDSAVRRLAGAGDLPVAPSSHPPFVGHEAVTDSLLRDAEAAAAGGVRVALVRGRPGIGMSRLLGELAAVAAAKQGFAVLTSACTAHRRAAFSSLSRALEEVEDAALDDVQAAVDDARKPIVAATPGAMDACVEQIEGALLAASRATPLYWVLDDAQWADERTLELVGLLGERAGRKNRAKLVVLVGVRLGSRGSALDALLGRVAAPGQPGIAALRLRPLEPAPAQKLLAGVAPAAPELTARVLAGAAGVPQDLVLPLLGWHEAGLLEWEGGCWHAKPAALAGPVPGAPELMRARVSSFFEASSEAGAAAHDLLGLAALHGGFVPRGRLLASAVASGLDPALVERVLDVIVEAQLLDVQGADTCYGFSQGLEREAARAGTEAARAARLHRALLDTIAREPDPRAEAVLLAQGYRELGDAGAARHWYELAILRALSEGSFGLAAELAEEAQRLGGSAVERFRFGLLGVDALTRCGRQKEARAELARLDASEAPPRERLRARIAEARVRAANSEGGSERELALVRDADALAEPILALDARLVAAVLVGGEAGMRLASEAIELARVADLARRYQAQIVRTQIAYHLPHRDLAAIAADIATAQELAAAAGAPWMGIEPAVDLACIRSDTDPDGAGRELAALQTRADDAGLARLGRLALSNLAAVELRLGRLDQAARHARELVSKAQAVGEAGKEGIGQGILADALYRAHLDLGGSHGFAGRGAEGPLIDAQAAADAAVDIKQRAASASVALALLRAASIAAVRGDDARARGAAGAAIAAAGQAPYHDLGERAALWLALYRARAGDPGATAELAAALATAERLGAAARPATLALIAEARAFVPA